ncbi:MAG: efflux RND transporter periplasmic adaptor subunit [Proteobacteria bacterium]|nr:efflux RND transporter periplasmic adaptor subunit [Pseudomonadota bacterium]
MTIGKSKRLLLVAAAIVLLGLLAYVLVPRLWLGSGGEPAFSGTIEATEAQLGFQSPGRIEVVRPVEGDRVNVGDELAWLDRAEMQARREQVLAQVAAARAALDELESGARVEELAQAQAVLAAARDRLQDARRDLGRARQLYEGGAVGAETRDKSQLAVDVASSQVEQARQQLRLLQAGPRSERIAAQRAQLAQVDAALKVIDAQLANMTIRAPFAGIVTVRHREPGETTAAGAPVLTLLNPSDRWVRIYVPETRIGQLSLGNRAQITIDSFPDKRYDGEVEYIASAAEFTPKTVQTTEERVKLVYAVKVRVTGDTALELKPGLPADVTLLGTPQ